MNKYEKYLRKLPPMRAREIRKLFMTDELADYGWTNYWVYDPEHNGSSLSTVTDHVNHEIVVYSDHHDRLVEYWGNGVWKVY